VGWVENLHLYLLVLPLPLLLLLTLSSSSSSTAFFFFISCLLLPLLRPSLISGSSCRFHQLEGFSLLHFDVEVSFAPSSEWISLHEVQFFLHQPLNIPWTNVQMSRFRTFGFSDWFRVSDSGKNGFCCARNSPFFLRVTRIVFQEPNRIHSTWRGLVFLRPERVVHREGFRRRQRLKILLVSLLLVTEVLAFFLFRISTRIIFSICQAINILAKPKRIKFFVIHLIVRHPFWGYPYLVFALHADDGYFRSANSIGAALGPIFETLIMGCPFG